jgi:magnesium chelatase family protein
VTLARTTSINLLGLKGEPIEIEVDVSNGLPAYSLLGLPDATLSESRDRIRAAIMNSGRNWPNRKVTVSLSPAWLPKSGSAFDLPIALSILTASGQLKESDLSKAFFPRSTPHFDCRSRSRCKEGDCSKREFSGGWTT